MAGKLLKETKDIEVKKKKRNNKVKEDDIYKIYLDLEQNVPQYELRDEDKFIQNFAEEQLEEDIEESTKTATKKVTTKRTKSKVEEDNSIIKIDDEEEEIDEIFGNVNKWLKDAEDEVIEKRPKRRLAKIEEGIKSSKTSKSRKISEDTKEIKTTKVTKAEKNAKTEKTTTKVKKRGRPKKIPETTLELENTEILGETEEIAAITEKPNEIQIHTENNLTEIVLKKNRYKIELQKNEYNIYTNTNETSYLIVRDPALRIVSGGAYILLEKEEENYEITTNQDFKINYIIDNLERKNNTVNFKLTNLTEIEAFEDGLVFEIDEEKVIENSLEDNNTLVISEEDGKVYLPYTKDDIKNEVLQNKGTKISEVIEDKYILPLDKYKNSMRARFREGYNLMYKKEGKPKRSAIMLGIELMFETNLHPAIISACKNLEELDIYLDCLEDNELEKFSCFKIIYKSLPTLRKKAKFQEF